MRGLRNGNKHNTEMKRIVSKEVRETLRNNGLINSKLVQQLSIYDGSVLAEYPSINQAARLTGICHNSISRCCRGISAYANHYRFKFKKRELKTKENGERN